MKNIKEFEWELSLITFEFKEGQQMVNATQMAKSFGKRVQNFMRLKTTKDFISLVNDDLKSVHSHVSEREAIRVVQGGPPNLQGTWMEEKLALKFAAWLSPAFELWVYGCIRELLLKGSTELPGRVSKKTLDWYLSKIADNVDEANKLIRDLTLRK